jgi:hypothetical protein
VEKAGMASRRDFLNPVETSLVLLYATPRTLVFGQVLASMDQTRVFTTKIEFLKSG